MIILLPMLVALVGMLAYALLENSPKAAELGRISFACGLLVTCWQMASRMLHLP